ncbi:hypothetical protein AWB67_05053 [Caballeronia terrestris]|uniref:Uncharacterized protein n=1 Tax=Caballeronia terrestris TaxID=1226301 RepID=A0A158K9R1_9BURK|nr:hypothetical protein [Caballeronia terrestris]SAL77191.1 hypothetical protein AWB67_05053 [Caballeronia terrestris]
MWFRGAIASGSIDTDLQVPNLAVVITLEEHEDTEGNSWADISYRTSAERTLTIAPANATDGIVGGQVLREERTPCGNDVKYGSWSTFSFCQFDVATTGFGGSATPLTPPTVTWTVGGKPVWGSQGTVDVPFDGSEFTLEYTIDPVSFELALTSRGGERYSTEVTATATEAGGGAAVSASATFNALGYFEGYSPEDKALVLACISRIGEEHRIPIPRRFRRPDPDPRFEIDIDQWRQETINQIRTQLQLDTRTERALTDIVRLQAPG